MEEIVKACLSTNDFMGRCHP
jgi:hypothetical protein